MMVYNVKKALFVAFNGFDGAMIEVNRDLAFMAKLLDSEEEFLKYLDTDTPPPLKESDHVKIIIEKDDESIDEWIALKNQITFLQGLEKRQRGIIEAHRDSRNVQFCSGDGIPVLKLTRVSRDGNVDWKSLCKANKISDEEIQKHRKPEGSSYYKYTISK
jgi:hypothetical protein